MKNLLLLFLFTFVWVCLLPLYPSVSVKEENPVPEDEYVISVMLGMTEDILPPESLKAIAVTVRTYTAYHGKVLPQEVKAALAFALSVCRSHTSRGQRFRIAAALDAAPDTVVSP